MQSAAAHSRDKAEKEVEHHNHHHEDDENTCDLLHGGIDGRERIQCLKNDTGDDDAVAGFQNLE